MFRPDNMCQQIVSLFVSLQNDLSAKLFKSKYYEIINATTSASSPDTIQKKMVGHLMYKTITGIHAAGEDIDKMIVNLPHSNVMLGHFKYLLDNNQSLPPCNEYTGELLNGIEPITIREFYIWYLQRSGIPANRAIEDNLPLDLERSTFYYTFYIS